MSSGYVIFDSQESFDAAHDAAKLIGGYPIIGSVNGVLTPSNQQTTAITSSTEHPSNGTVVAYINGGWDESLKAGLTFNTRAEVSEYFPEDR